MLLVGAQNGLEVSNEDYSQSRCPILVSHYASPQKKPEPSTLWFIDALSALLSSRAESG